MPVKLSERELVKLQAAHPDLKKVVLRLVDILPETLPIVILEVARTVEQQRKNVARGASRTMKSRHIPSSNKCNMSCAVDIAPSVKGQASWHWPLYHKLAPFVKQAAKDVGVKIEWGGDWRSFKDGPHWQLPWKEYP